MVKRYKGKHSRLEHMRFTKCILKIEDELCNVVEYIDDKIEELINKIK